MMIEILSTTAAIGGVWIFGFGSQCRYNSLT
jgi:hypothetical protein